MAVQTKLCFESGQSNPVHLFVFYARSTGTVRGDTHCKAIIIVRNKTSIIEQFKRCYKTKYPQVMSRSTNDLI